MTAPERIWAIEDGFGDNWWSMQEYDGATKYVRADLAYVQPDPRDEVIARLVEALVTVNGITEASFPQATSAGDVAEIQKVARAALASAKAVHP